MKNVKTMGLGLAASIALLGACDSDDDNNNADAEAIVCDGTACDITGDILVDTTLDAANVYTLQTGINVGDDAGTDVTLTIPAGTLIKGTDERLSFIAVQRGSKIEANGTAAAPVVFTSGAAEGGRQAGDWGGLIINGRATSNAGNDVVGEGGTGNYGGTDDGDSSGTLSYVRVEFAGRQITNDNELNGIAFQGVGSGTTVSNIHVHQSKDDGVEFFGGTVSATNVILTCIGDDNLDWTDGWTGGVTNLVAHHCAGDGDNGIEADNDGDDPNASPRSKPTLDKMTFIAAPGGADSDFGMLLRRGTGATISNSIFVGYSDACVAVDTDQTFTNFGADLTMTNTLIACEGALFCDVRNLTDAADMDHCPEVASAAVEAWFTGRAGNASLTTVAGTLTNAPVAPNDFASLDFSPAAAEATGKGADLDASWTAFPEN